MKDTVGRAIDNSVEKCRGKKFVKSPDPQRLCPYNTNSKQAFQRKESFTLFVFQAAIPKIQIKANWNMQYMHASHERKFRPFNDH
jgi:hypothetical protein